MNTEEQMLTAETEALVVRDVVKNFRRGRGLRKKVTRAVDGASLAARRGELFGLLGPNGAGKTTLVRCIATLLIPEQGEIRVLGRDVFKHSTWCRRRIGLLTSGERTLYWKLTARANLEFFAALYGLAGREKDKRIDYLLELLGLKDVARERVERYSSGMKQKLSLARALVHDPELLLLDEPTIGLDPQFARFMRRFIREELKARHRKTILLTTHYMDEADELCDRIAFINRGRIVNIKTPAQYKRDIPHKDILELRCQGRPDITALQALPGVENAAADSADGITTVRVVAPDVERVLSEVVELLRPQSRLLGVDVKLPTLEDVFLHETGVSLGEDTRQQPPPVGPA